MCRNLDEHIAQELIEDAKQCITSHLGDYDQKDWNPEIYKGDLEMTAQTIEQTCDIEFGRPTANEKLIKVYWYIICIFCKEV